MKAGNRRAVLLLPGCAKMDITVRYLAVELEDALSISEADLFPRDLATVELDEISTSTDNQIFETCQHPLMHWLFEKVLGKTQLQL